MHLALGSQQLDLTARSVVVGLLEPADPPRSLDVDAIRLVDDGADAVWVAAGASTIADVAALVPRLDRAVGADVADAGAVDELAAAGVAAVGVPADRPDVLDAAARRGMTVLIGGPGQVVDAARRARGAGLAESRLVLDDVADGAGLGVGGITAGGAGPATWGAVAAALERGAGVVRTVDVRSVRRVATVVARLQRARAIDEGGAPT